MLFNNKLKIIAKTFKFFNVNKNLIRGLSSANGSQNDIIIKSAFPSINYPSLTIDQFVWKDIDKWMNKTAIASFNKMMLVCVKLLIIFNLRWME